MKVAQKTYRLYKIQKRNSPVQFCMGLYKQKTREIILRFFVQEAQIGFEPVIRELQSHALPLGYRPILLIISFYIDNST